MYNLKICHILRDAEEEMLSLKHMYVRTEHLFLSLLKNSEDVKKLCFKYNLTYDVFKEKLISMFAVEENPNNVILYDSLLKKVLYSAEEMALNENNILNELYLFKSILGEDDGNAIKIIYKLGIDSEKLYKDIIINKLDLESLSIMNIGTNLMNNINLNEKVYGRDDELEQIIQILIRKNKNNPLLIGEAGVGKTAIIEELSRRIKSGKVPDSLKNSIIVNLELGTLLAGTKYRGEFEEKLTNIIKELENNPNIILFIDEFHGIVNAGGADGAINACDILKPYLARGKIKVIGATTFNEYNKFILSDKALCRRFETLRILEPNNEETVKILTALKMQYENHYNLKISSNNIIDIVFLADKYIKNRCNPDKSIDLLDSVCAGVVYRNLNYENFDNINMMETKKNECILVNNYDKAIYYEQNILRLKNISTKNTINKNDIIMTLSKKYNLFSNFNKKQKLLILKKKLLKKFPSRVSEITKTINILNNNLGNGKIINILLSGDNINEKKQFVNAISEYLKISFINVDLSLFDNNSILNYLMDSKKSILRKISLEPFSIIMLNNFDKTSDDVRNFFYKIMNDGEITNFEGDNINFNNAICFILENSKNSKRIGFNNNISNSLIFSNITNIEDVLYN